MVASASSASWCIQSDVAVASGVRSYTTLIRIILPGGALVKGIRLANHGKIAANSSVLIFSPFHVRRDTACSEWFASEQSQNNRRFPAQRRRGAT
jgi:hypothetical protein